MKLSQNSIDKMTEYGIPDYMQPALTRYWNDRLEPGDFLMAVLENDLVGAFSYADHQNKEAMYAYVMWLYNCPPGRPNGWGSPEAVKKWLAYDPDAKREAQ